MPPQGRSWIESYPDCMKRIDKKIARQYRFITNPIREQLTIAHSSFLLLKQMVKNIQDREAKGIDQTETWEALKSLTLESNKDNKDVNIPASTLNLYQQLLVEANAQLGLYQLPEEDFGKHEPLIRLTQYETMKKYIFDGEDPKKSLKRLEIQANTQVETNVFKQLSDGSVPSFEKFASTKKAIQKINSGGGVNTPLKEKTKREETLAQYQKLNAMITERNFDRVRKLQAGLDQNLLPLELQ